MNSVVITSVLIPGFVSGLLFLVFTYLYEQSRQQYFRAWQLAWAAYSLHYIFDYFPVVVGRFLRQRIVFGRDGVVHFCLDAHDARAVPIPLVRRAVGAIGVILALLTLRGHIVNGAFHPDAQPAIRLGLGLAIILLYCSAVFLLNGHRRGSVGFQVLAIALALWGVLMGVGQLQNPLVDMFGNASRLFGPVPQMLLGIAMVMVLFENQRNAVQENTLALSTLGVDARRLLFAEDLMPSMQAALERLRGALNMDCAAIVISERWRGLLPSVQQGFSEAFCFAGDEAARAITSANLPIAEAAF